MHAIYATELGALAAALHYTQPNPNRVDWALLRFTEKNLRKPEGKLSFVRMQSPESDLSGKVREVFGTSRVETYADRLHILLSDPETGETQVAKSGELWRAVRAALSGSNGYSAFEFEGRRVKTSKLKLLDVYRMAHQDARYPVVVVSAGKPLDEALTKLVVEQAYKLITVPLPNIQDLDVKKRNQAVFSGKNAVHQVANEILGLVGRKAE